MPVGTISSSADTVGVGVINYRVPVCETHEEVIANCQCVLGGTGCGGQVHAQWSAADCWLLADRPDCLLILLLHRPCSKIADTVAGMKRGYPGLDLSECARCLL